MKVLLSIKPEFAEKIFSGDKKYEFRKVIFKNQNVKKIYVYASHPIQKVIGEFEIDKILKKEIESLWHITKEKSGITKDYFLSYFIDRTHGFAIKIKKTKKYKSPKCIFADFNAYPPQSFIYIK
jgi:predicted transcriptional regulator